jgi:hypothetical protein
MKDDFTKQWIIENALIVLREYSAGELTIRGLHYRLVSRGMTNDLNHYKRVVNAMIDARWDHTIEFRAFSDHDREMLGFTDYEEISLESKVDTAKIQIKAWMTSYSRNRWENQKWYPEVFIEKKALQGVFESVTRRLDVALGACKGYPSLTFLFDTYRRLRGAYDDGHQPVILYFGDYDPSGEDIPRAIEENINRMAADNGSDMRVTVKRCALMEQQVVEMQLPPAPVKIGDTRSAKWDGLGQVELDAVDPRLLQKMCRDAINEMFDPDTHAAVLEREATERDEFQRQLREYVNEI